MKMNIKCLETTLAFATYHNIYSSFTVMQKSKIASRKAHILLEVLWTNVNEMAMIRDWLKLTYQSKTAQL